jgi:hypothetical protein
MDVTVCLVEQARAAIEQDQARGYCSADTARFATPVTRVPASDYETVFANDCICDIALIRAGGDIARDAISEKCLSHPQ